MNVTRSYGVPYTIENPILAKMTERYLKDMLLLPQNRRLSTVSDITASLNYYPEEIATLNTVFITDSSNAAVLDSLVESSLGSIAYGKGDTREFEQIKQAMQEEFANTCNSSYYWLEAIEHRYMENIDFHSNYSSVLTDITEKQLSGFVKNLLEKGNKISIIMDGTTEDVNTQNLFRENDFIREFFGIE